MMHEPKAPTLTSEPTRSPSGPRRRNSSISSTQTAGKLPKLKVAAARPNARARIKGFTETVKKYDNLKLVASQPGNWDRMTALNVTSNILRQHPDLGGNLRQQ